MTTLIAQDLDEAAALAGSNQPEPPPPEEPADFGAELRQRTAAVRIQHEKFGIRRTLDEHQLREAAEAFGAVARSISASKKLIDTSHPAYRAVTGIRSDATGYWRALTVPFPEPGVRLIRRDRIPEFEAQMNESKARLADAAADLQTIYSDLRSKARQDLGDLFKAADYPPRIDNQFALSWDYPSTDPPRYLQELAPELYAREQQRIVARFDEAIRLTEEAFTAELAKLVEHLADRLSGDVDGKPKIFRNSAIDNLQEFVGRFRGLAIGSSEQLDQLVTDAEQLIGGVDPDDLRANINARDRVAQGMAGIGKTLDGLMVERAKRAISFEDEDDQDGGAE